ncbi:LrgB family protein [Pontibacillus salicampi]|uniref:LrgB family protein n=1 Tax=Pontibacillus salicampi TaxID=1449801 RepID=A0ABV6LI02_9BACI
MNNLWIGSIGLISTLLLYYGTKKLHQRFPSPFLLPVLTSTIVIGAFLLLWDIPYEVYMTGGKVVDWLLGPAVVALAYPLYRQWEVLKRYWMNILSSVTVGAIIGVTSGILFSNWLNVEEYLIYSLIPKNSTTPVAMSVADSIGGIPSMAAVFVMIAGIGGAVFGPIVLKWATIDHFLGRGIGFGSASHAIGTSKAMENSEEEGTVSTVAMILSAIIISIISPLFVYLLL